MGISTNELSDGLQMLKQIFKDWAPLVNSAAFIALVTIAWKSLRSLVEMKRDISTIMTNHIPHLQQEISDLRTDFTNSLINGRN